MGSPGLTCLNFYNALHQYGNSRRQSFPRVSPTLSDVTLLAPFELVSALLTQFGFAFEWERSKSPVITAYEALGWELDFSRRTHSAVTWA